jgi:hypothetical protein
MSRRDEMLLGWDAALDNTLIEVCAAAQPGCCSARLMLKEILFLQCGALALGAFAFRECARLFLSLARPTSASVPICDFKLFSNSCAL